MSSLAKTSVSILMMLDIANIAEIFISEGFAVFGSYVHYRSWCDESKLEPTNIHTILQFMMISDKLIDTIYVNNSKSKSIKRAIELATEKYPDIKKSDTNEVDHYYCEDHITPYKLYYKCTHRRIDIDIFDSMAMYNKFATFDIDLLQYSSDGYNLTKPAELAGTSVDLIRRNIFNRTVKYICKLSGDKSKTDRRIWHVQATFALTNAGWTIPDWDIYFRKDTRYRYPSSCCPECERDVDEIRYITKDKSVCNDCLCKLLEEYAAHGRYISGVEPKKLILPI